MRRSPHPPMRRGDPVTVRAAVPSPVGAAPADLRRSALAVRPCVGMGVWHLRRHGAAYRREGIGFERVSRGDPSPGAVRIGGPVTRGVRALPRAHPCTRRMLPCRAPSTDGRRALRLAVALTLRLSLRAPRLIALAGVECPLPRCVRIRSRGSFLAACISPRTLRPGVRAGPVLRGVARAEGSGGADPTVRAMRRRCALRPCEPCGGHPRSRCPAP